MPPSSRATPFFLWALQLLLIISIAPRHYRSRRWTYFAMAEASSSTSSPAQSRTFRSNPWEILGLRPSSTQKEISQRYKSLCLEHHPDKKRGREKEEREERRGGDSDSDDDFAFKEIQHAYSLVGDEESRRVHDRDVELRNILRRRASSGLGGGDAPSSWPRRRRTPFVSGGFGVPIDDAFARRFFSNGAWPRRTGGFYFKFGSSSVSFPPNFSSPLFELFGNRDDTYSKSQNDVSGPADVGFRGGGRPLYLQTATVPLENLYGGRRDVEFRCRLNRRSDGPSPRPSSAFVSFTPFSLVPSSCSVFAERCLAAHRGRTLGPILLRGLIASGVAWIRLTYDIRRQRYYRHGGGNSDGIYPIDRWIPIVVSAVLFVSLIRASIKVAAPLPDPDRTYHADIVRGWKDGTEVRFRRGERCFVDDGPACEDGGGSGDEKVDVTFVIREGKHPLYERVGDDLLTDARASRRDLRKGCVLRIPPLSSLHGSGSSIEVRLRPRQINSEGQIVRVKGLGWPKENTADGGDAPSFGDLLVRIRMHRSSGKRGRKRKRTAKKRL